MRHSTNRINKNKQMEVQDRKTHHSLVNEKEVAHKFPCPLTTAINWIEHYFNV